MPKLLLGALTLLLLAACAQAGSTPAPSPTPSSYKALAPPILTEPQAIETAGQVAARSRRGLTGVSNIRNQRARLMTMGEYWALGQYDYGFFGSAEWYPESGLPVWVVLMDGDSESTLQTYSLRVGPAGRASLSPTRYSHFVVVLNAHTGYQIGFSPLSAPDQLFAEAQGLHPALYARYPLEAPLEYTKDITEFPVSEPSFLPAGFSLAGVTLELAHPLRDILPYPQEPRQTVLQNYSNGQGSTIQLAQFRGELPDLIEDADMAAVQETKAWVSHEAGKSTWLAWTWVFPEAGAYVTYILYSEAPLISLDTLHEIAASMPAGQPPSPAPEPVRAPTALPRPTVLLEESALAQQRGGLATVIIGQVVRKTREKKEPSPIGGIGCPCTNRYGFWRVKVERYLANPQPYDEITFKVIEETTRSDGTPALRFGGPPPLPREGERAVFFLKRRISSLYPLLTGDTYGGFQAIKRIEDGLVDVAPYSGIHQPQWMPLDDFVDSIMAMASQPAAPEEPGWQGPGPPPTPTPPPLTLTPTPTPMPRPTVDQVAEEGPPKGRGVVIGQPYSFRIGGHCGVRDTLFDGRWWLPDPVPAYGSNNPPTTDDGAGTMTLVAEDRAVFAAKSGRTVEFLPRPPDVESRLCY